MKTHAQVDMRSSLERLWDGWAHGSLVREPFFDVYGTRLVEYRRNEAEPTAFPIMNSKYVPLSRMIETGRRTSKINHALARAHARNKARMSRKKKKI